MYKTQIPYHLNCKWTWLSRFIVTLGHYDGAIGLSTYVFQLTFNSNIRHNLAPLWDIHVTLQNLSDLEFDLSVSLKVKC